MKSVIKVKEIKIENLRNVKSGSICTPVQFSEFEKADIVGLYGQNGSGKTTIVEAFSIVNQLFSGGNNYESFPGNLDNMICFIEQYATIEIEFLVKNSDGEYFLKYFVELCEGKDRVYPTKEKLSYRENEKFKRYKNLISKENDSIQFRAKDLSEFHEEDRIKVMVLNKFAKERSMSFIFHKELREMLQGELEHFEFNLIENIAVDFYRDLHVINNESIGYLMMKHMMPFSIHLDRKRGFIPYDLETPALLPTELYTVLVEAIAQTNKVLTAIIPGLTIEIRHINDQLNDRGEEAVRFEFLSRREDSLLPLRTESEGILKIISVLSVLIAVYNNPNATVVIDELDAGIYEYLLGELLTVISEGGKGQLLFTSHNLRVLEVLTPKDLWFTTVNADHRYIQLKGIKKMNNTRDVYLRSIQLGGQDELIYQKTKTHTIKRAFRKAGVRNE
ncbi:AAA family ATPase [Sporosarcina sp. NPDC096371]|uniref:AAA family ATPase n=1 Tax=Sporosarcina sp. NPDC096371 TaxID=3364530 RepID=UPI0037FD954F